MAGNEEIRVTITGDGSGAIQAFDAVTKKATETKAEVEKLTGLDAVMESLSHGLLHSALGFGTMAGAGAMAAEKIAEAFKEIASAVPEAIHATNELAAQFMYMRQTAGLSIPEFNRMNAAMKMAGGSGEEFTGIVTGMQRGIRSNAEFLILNGIAADKAALSHMGLEEYLRRAVEMMNSLSDATERDQFMLRAFGRSGVAVATEMKNMSLSMEEAAELALENGPITEQAVVDLESHRVALAHWNTMWENVQASVAHAAIPMVNSAHMAGEAFLKWSNAGGVLAGILTTIRDVMGNFMVQAALVAGLLNAAIIPAFIWLVSSLFTGIPALWAWIASIPIVTVELDSLGLTVATTTVTVAGLEAALAAIDWPLVAIAAVLGVVATAFWHQGNEAKEAAEKTLEHAKSAREAGEAIRTMTEKLKTLDEIIKNSKTSQEDKNRALKDHDIVMAQLNRTYPEFNALRVFEADGTVNLTKTIAALTKARRADLEVQLAAAEANLALLKQGTDERGEGRFEEHTNTWLPGEMEHIDTKPEILKLAEKSVVALEKAVLDAGLAADNHIKMVPKKGRGASSDNFDSDLAAQDRLEITLRDKTTLEAQALAAQDTIALDFNDKRIGYNKRLEKSGEELAEGRIKQAEYDKRYAEYELVWARSLDFEKAASKIKSDEYARKRADAETKLMDELTVKGEEGYAQRVAKTKKWADAELVEIRKLYSGEKLAEMESLVAAKVVDADRQSLRDQKKKDLSDLNNLLRQENLKSPMSVEDTKKFIAGYGRGADGKRDAAKEGAAGEKSAELHLDGTATGGAMAGLKKFRAETENIYTSMQNLTHNVANSMSSGIGKAFTDMIVNGKKFGDVMKALWKDVASSVIGGLIQIAVRQGINWALEGTIFAERKAERKIDLVDKGVAAGAGAAIDAAATTTSVVASAVQTGAAEMAMAAKIYAWYSGLGPWAIPAAAATIAAIIAAIGSITAHADGGLIDRPTLALMGEAGPEIVAPKKNFQDWANANQNLGYNLASHNARVSGLQSSSGEYGSQAMAASASSGGGGHVDLRGAVIAGESAESARIISALVKKSMDNYGRRNG